MLTVDGEALKPKVAKSRKTLTLLPQAVKSPALQRASEEFGGAELSGEVSGTQQKSVCVLQGEYAEVDLSKEDLVLASTGATTCCIAALVAPKQWGLIAHLDERCCQQLAVLAPLVAARSGAVQLFLVGGYGSRGEVVAEEVLKAMHGLPQLSVDLRLAAVGTLNQHGESRNILHRSLAVDTATSAARPAETHDQGPLVAMRAARPFSRVAAPMEPVYDTAAGQLRIAPVQLDLASCNKAELLQMIAMDDADLLEQSSTSPVQEGPGFVADVRATLKWMLQAKGGKRAAAKFAWVPDVGWQSTKKEKEPAALEGGKPRMALTMSL